MDSPPLHDVLGALAQAIADFDRAATGEPGHKVMALGPAAGALPDLIRSVLGAIRTALSGLRTAMIEGEKWLIQADAALALLIVVDAALVGLLDAVGKAGDGLGQTFDLGALQDTSTALQPVKDALAKAEVLDDVLPLPEDVHRVRAALNGVLGAEAGPAGGSLGQVLEAITPGT
jgi:hypothetical protein